MLEREHYGFQSKYLKFSHLVETKGIEDIEMDRKDNRAHKWCHDAADLTGQPWYYVKIPWKVFQETTATTFDGLYRHALASEA